MARVYVGNLPIDIRTRDIEDLFFKYGRIRDIDLKAPARPPAFCFVSFENYDDARDAVEGRDGVQFEGARLRVEMSRSDGGGRGGGGGGGGGGGYGGRDDYNSRGPPRRDSYDDRRGPPPRRAAPRDLRRSEHRVIISGLPPSASWQDLKDFFRQAGDVIFTDVDRHGGGIVEFANKSDQEYAISKLDDTEFVSEYKNQGDKAYVRVKKPRDQMTSVEREADKDDKPRDRSRSRDRKASRSRSRSKGRDRSRSRSKGRDSRSRSRSKGRDDKKDDDKREDKKDEDKKEDDKKEEKDSPKAKEEDEKKDD